MAELDELCKFLNLNPSDSIEDIKEQFNTNFIAADPKAIKANDQLYGSLLGELNGTLVNKIKAVAKSVGVELTKEEIEGKKTVEIIELLDAKAGEVFGSHKTQLEELEKAVKTAQKSGASAKDIEALQVEVETYKKKYEETNGLLQTTVQDFEGYKGTVAEKENQFVINNYKNNAISSVKLATKSDYERIGFLTDIDKKYVLQRDGDEVVVRDKEGNQIKHPDMAGKFMSYTDVLTMEAKKANLLQDNPHADKIVHKPTVKVIPQSDNQSERKVARPLMER